jgi:hypothetical protein
MITPGLHLNTGDSGASDWYARLAVVISNRSVGTRVTATLRR